jgi:ferrous iron transport protein B
LLLMYALSTVSALGGRGDLQAHDPQESDPAAGAGAAAVPAAAGAQHAAPVYDRTADFVRDAGTVILAMTVVLWALLSFPTCAVRAAASPASSS